MYSIVMDEFIYILEKLQKEKPDEISKSTFEIIMNLITTNVVFIITENNKWSEDYALESFTKSKLYSELEIEKTKIWHKSCLEIASLFNDEMSESNSLSYVEGMSKTLDFKAFCFEAYKAEHNQTGYETMELFKKYGVLDFLDSCYNPLHSQGRDYIISDIDMYINARR